MEYKEEPVPLDSGRKGDWIETYTGGFFFPLDPQIDEINIRDIAHSLSLICRFNGMCSEFYSVAQHSVEVSKYIETMNIPYTALDQRANRDVILKDHAFKMIKLRGLLHDGAESYCADVPRPIKPFLTGYKEIENKIEYMIYRKYGCDDKFVGINDADKYVKQADTALLATEARDLGMNKNKDWYLPYDPWDKAIIPMTPKESERYFLDRFYELTGGL